jgi:Glyoxalase-like domain
VPREVARLEALGATRAAWPYYPPGADWVVMLDPDGNEFCVVPA